ncbi:M20/M25/M40 family metallo-hydrolase [Methanobrevibacter filiformis]|uniref:Peptidase T n=1 Tax=Methanobrevibacter filiformis TaxID=55758 RepID=A0A166DK59_9EURY|nr:M20/M25/M40 family metallo-hydrolase [Methanobrevibacter filiformis]KZX15680.1 peptidase T [Methanobrevibacter filiformis]
MNTERLLQTFSELVSIDNPSLSERLVCDYITSHLKKIGFTTYEDNVGEELGGNCGNLYGFLQGDEPLKPLMFSAHMDAVEPSLGKQAIFHEDGSITSDGTTVLGADALAGISAILEAITTIKENNLSHRPIEVLFFVAEEIYGLGSKIFDYSILKSKESYTLDLSGKVGSAAYKAPTLISFNITIKGKSGHTGFTCDESIHTIAIVSEAITKLKMGRVDKDSTINIGLIQGGLAPNIVPDSCEIKGEIRSHTHSKAIDLVNETIDVFSKTAKKYGATLISKDKIHIKAYETPLNHSVVKRFQNVCAELNISPALHSTLGGSDNNNIEEHGINGLVLATAMNNTHSCEEYSSVSELENITKIVINLMRSRD